jgi:hypothetical protein
VVGADKLGERFEPVLHAPYCWCGEGGGSAGDGKGVTLIGCQRLWSALRGWDGGVEAAAGGGGRRRGEHKKGGVLMVTGVEVAHQQMHSRMHI